MIPRTKTNYIVIHCSATRADQHINTDDIRRWHMNDNGWSDIGYHWVVERDGSVQQGRDVDVQGAHVRGHNHESVGICMVGGMAENGEPEDNFTSEQWLALEMLIESLELRYPEAQVVGHYFFTPYKTCPNFIVEDWLESIQ
ncbi:N-acetylmuramoyl-L-alanine amidase [uncultured Endozoicomonas sp.]|uniref:N-acetylmuramoyl-L-alanine amidase n=1 Tax=uncultured Endozoicomonas sp. TaxID=432652 RepID=UPI002638852E|nr:N-acetylmuramoyl-L-alanine amidase [uncultured Endozoicomonas sp.]